MSKKYNEIVPVEIFSGTQGETDLLISLLENAKISAYLKDSFIGTIAPYMSPGGAAPITIVVSSEDEEKARQIVEEYLKDTGREP